MHHGKFLFCPKIFPGAKIFEYFEFGIERCILLLCFRLHGVCKDNPLAPLIGRLGLPLYRTSGDNSVLYDHDLERYFMIFFFIDNFL